MEAGDQRHAPVPLSPEKTRYPWSRRLGECEDRFVVRGKSRPHRDSIPGPSSLLYNYLNKLSVGKTLRSGFNNYTENGCLQQNIDHCNP